MEAMAFADEAQSYLTILQALGTGKVEGLRAAKRLPVGPALRKLAREWKELLGCEDVLIVDTETTGYNYMAEVIDIGVVDTTGHVVMDSLIMPEGHIHRDSLLSHGLTRQRLQAMGARPYPDVHHELSCALGDASLLVAYGSSFDERVVTQTAERHNLPLWTPRWRCAMSDYAAAAGRRKLHDLAEALGVETGRSHRAMSDALTLLGVMRAVVELV